jgi:hypothetical protein
MPANRAEGAQRDYSVADGHSSAVQSALRVETAPGENIFSNSAMGTTTRRPTLTTLNLPLFANFRSVNLDTPVAFSASSKLTVNVFIDSLLLLSAPQISLAFWEALA